VQLVVVTDATPIARHHHRVMTGMGGSHRRPTDADRAFFEILLVLRNRYAARGIDDATSAIGLRHAIVAANATMADAAPSPTIRLGVKKN
jgi:hypothetical protein